MQCSLSLLKKKYKNIKHNSAIENSLQSYFFIIMSISLSLIFWFNFIRSIQSFSLFNFLNLSINPLLMLSSIISFIIFSMNSFVCILLKNLYCCFNMDSLTRSISNAAYSSFVSQCFEMFSIQLFISLIFSQ
jgi:hypothetical protein